jgi:hypothetical protein
MKQCHKCEMRGNNVRLIKLLPTKSCYKLMLQTATTTMTNSSGIIKFNKFTFDCDLTSDYVRELIKHLTRVMLLLFIMS